MLAYGAKSKRGGLFFLRQQCVFFMSCFYFFISCLKYFLCFKQKWLSQIALHLGAQKERTTAPTSSSKIYEGSSFNLFSEKSTSCSWVFQKMEMVSGRLSIRLKEALHCFCRESIKQKNICVMCVSVTYILPGQCLHVMTRNRCNPFLVVWL